MPNNKTCHRDRIARLTAPCPSHINFNVKLFANAAADADANANARGSTIALPGLCPGELKIAADNILIFYFYISKKIRLDFSCKSFARQRNLKLETPNLIFSENNDKIFMNVVCCSLDWRFKG